MHIKNQQACMVIMEYINMNINTTQKDTFTQIMNILKTI